MSEAVPSVPPPAVGHANWKNVLVDYGSLVAILVALLTVQVGAYAALWAQTSTVREKMAGQGEKISAVDKRLDHLEKRSERLEVKIDGLTREVADLRVAQVRMDAKLDRVIELLSRRR